MSTAPIREALQYENRVVNTTITHLNSFSGPPGPDIDRAWKDILGHGRLRGFPVFFARIENSKLIAARSFETLS